MPIFRYSCKTCGNEFSSFKKSPLHCEIPAEKLLSAPAAKFMEPTNKEKGKSIIKDQKRLLMERAKEHARVNDYHDLVQTNEKDLDLAKRQGWLSETGGIRKKVDNL